MKIRERKTQQFGFGAGGTIERVREVTEGEPVPAGAETVPDETPVSDWRAVDHSTAAEATTGGVTNGG